MVRCLWVDNGDGLGIIIDPSIPESELDECIEYAKQINVGLLWQSAHNYENKYISGSAIGMLTIGVLQNFPKSVAVKNWINSIWALYYQRKATMNHYPISESDLDFSSCGPCPYSVPELIAEVNV